jgi:hypothetical protein
MDMVVDELDGSITNVALCGRLDRLGAETIDLRFGEIVVANFQRRTGKFGFQFFDSRR